MAENREDVFFNFRWGDTNTFTRGVAFERAKSAGFGCHSRRGSLGAFVSFRRQRQVTFVLEECETRSRIPCEILTWICWWPLVSPVCKPSVGKLDVPVYGACGGGHVLERRRGFG